MSKKRSASSGRWIAEHETDPYVQAARKQGLRSRAAFKLLEIQKRDKILGPNRIVVDLGAAPGGWSQVARPLLGSAGQLIALDILPMSSLPDVDVITGDFRDNEVLQILEAKIGAASVDLVMSDMAPNVSGIPASDQAGQIYLCELALDFATSWLKPTGDFLVKVFQGDGFEAYLKSVRAKFESVSVRKPKASRARSREVYLLARRLRQV